MPVDVDLSRFDNRWYDPGGGPLKRGLWYVCHAVIFQSAFFPFYAIKRRLLRRFGADIGQGVIIKPRVTVKYPWHLRVGHHCWIGERVWIDNLATVTLGDNAVLSQGAMILCGNHDYREPAFDLVVKPVVLEKGVWIGARAVVCPGVVCKRESVLTVGSVATRDLDPFTVYRGNPATASGVRQSESIQP